LEKTGKTFIWMLLINSTVNALDPDEEYVVLPISILEKLIRYSMSFCENRCPAGRDPGTCIYLTKLAPALGLGHTPCYSDYGVYRRENFERVIKDTEGKYGLDRVSLLKMRRSTLETEIDLMELEFAIGVLKSMDESKPIYVVKGGDLSIRNAKRI